METDVIEKVLAEHGAVASGRSGQYFFCVCGERLDESWPLFLATRKHVAAQIKAALDAERVARDAGK